MNKYVFSSVDSTLQTLHGDDGSIVLCDECLKRHQKVFPDEGDDRIFDVRLFAGGEDFECEGCANAKDPMASDGDFLLSLHKEGKRYDPWKQSREQRSATLFRLTVGQELGRLTGITSQIAAVLAVILVMLLYPHLERVVSPHVGTSWTPQMGLGLVLFLAFRYGLRWFLTGRILKS